MGSSITNTLSFDTSFLSVAPFANCKKYKNVMNVLSPSLNVDLASVPSSLSI